MTLKGLLTLLGVVSTTILYAQTNLLTESEFYQTKFNNLTFTELSKTGADLSKITKLLGFPDSIREGTGGVGEGWKQYKFSDGFVIGYIDITSKDFTTSINYIRASSINIKGITVKVGDNISVFGEQTVKLPTSIRFIVSDDDCCPITIDYDQTTHLITKIEYKAGVKGS